MRRGYMRINSSPAAVNSAAAIYRTLRNKGHARIEKRWHIRFTECKQAIAVQKWHAGQGQAPGLA